MKKKTRCRRGLIDEAEGFNEHYEYDDCVDRGRQAREGLGIFHGHVLRRRLFRFATRTLTRARALARGQL